MSDRYDVVVVGGGIIGAWSAWHLANQGRSVAVLERDVMGSGSSLGNCGYICPSHVHPLCGPGAIIGGLKTMAHSGGALSIPPRFDPTLWRWLFDFARHCGAAHFQRASEARHALLESSRQLYGEYSVGREDKIGWQPNGLLMVYRSTKDFHAFEKSATELRDRFGLKIEQHDSDSLCRLESALCEGLAGGWYFPDDVHVSPRGLLNTLHAELVTKGVVIHEGTEVDKLNFRGQTLVSIQSQGHRSFAADHFLFATGAEAGRLGSELGCRLPIIPGKGYSVTIQTAGDTDADAMRIPMIFEDDHVAVTPLENSLRIGSTMQLTGFDRTIPQHRIDLLKRSAKRHLRVELPAGQECNWSGWRPMMPDGIPCIGGVPRAGNAWIAAGNGMVGMATGSGTGKLASEMILGLHPHLDPAPYRPDRFSQKRNQTTSSVHAQLSPQPLARDA